MKKSIWVIHFEGRCQTCDWSSQNYKNGQALSAKHAKHYKHLVHYEIGLCGDYDGTVNETDN